MSEPTQITLPKLGESITEATVVQWFKKVGDTIELDEPLLEVATDKINSEIPSPVKGTIQKICIEPDQTLKVGELLALISTEQSLNKILCQVEQKAKQEEEMQTFFSPAVLRFAREQKIPLENLEKIPGTGEGKRLTKKDIESYVSKKVPCTSGHERLKMTALRKSIAENMVRSFYEAPHASLVTEVDVTDILRHIKEQKEEFLKTHGVKLTVTSFVAKAMVQAIRSHPLINSSLEGDTIVMKRYVNLGIAVSVEQGILVPVIKHAENKDLTDLAKAIGSLGLKARNTDLSLEDMQEGSITLTNFGMGKAMIGIPIIRHPEVAILGIGAAHKKVAVLDDDTFGVRSVINISLTFDHRVLDGMYGCSFLADVKKYIETFFK